MSTFVCEGCADGLPADRVDAEATYPDAMLGGTDPKTGGHLCKACAVLVMSAEELDAEIRAEGLDPEREAERVREVMRDALDKYRAANPTGIPYEQEKAMRLWMKLNPPDGKVLTDGDKIGLIQCGIEEVVRDVKADCAATHTADSEELSRLRADVKGLEDAYADICRVRERLDRVILDYRKYHREHCACGRDDCPMCFGRRPGLGVGRVPGERAAEGGVGP